MHESSYYGESAKFVDLPKTKQLTCALLLFKRIQPLLLTFSRQTGFDPSPYARGEVAVWETIAGAKKPAKQALQSLSRSCFESAPNTESYPGELVSHALNAALCMANLLTFAVDGKLGNISEMTSWVRDSIDLHIQTLKRSPNAGNARHRATEVLLAKEIEKQRADIEFLTGLPATFDRQALAEIRSRASAQQPIFNQHG